MMLTKKTRGVELSGISEELKAKLAAWDADGDGNIDEAELGSMLEQFFRSQEMKKIYRNLLVALGVMMCLLIMFLSIMTYYVVDTAKDTSIVNDKLMARYTNEPAQCANSDFKLNADNVLVPRDTVVRRMLLSDGQTQDVVEALAVRNHMQSVELSSTLPDKYFEELLWFKITSNTGLQLSFRIQAITRLLTKAAKCGTYLKLVTNAGVIILDDKDIYYSNDLFGLFQESGFRLLNSVTKNKITGRRLQSSASGVSFSITGFFNAIKDYDWKCESIEKPNLPDQYALVTRTLSQCDKADSKCYFEPYPGRILPQYGVTEINGMPYYESRRDMIVQNDASHIIDYLDHRPGVKLVTSIFAASGKNLSTMMRYQVENDGQMTHCVLQKNVDEMKMTFPDDFIFYPIDDAGSDLMHFRISYQPDVPAYIVDMLAKTDSPVEAEPWVHVSDFRMILIYLSFC